VLKRGDLARRSELEQHVSRTKERAASRTEEGGESSSEGAGSGDLVQRRVRTTRSHQTQAISIATQLHIPWLQPGLGLGLCSFPQQR
jgi:hypothetical protein